MEDVLLVVAWLVAGIPLYLLIGRWMCRWPIAYMCAIGAAFLDSDWKNFFELVKMARKEFIAPFPIVIWPALMLVIITFCLFTALVATLYYLGCQWWRWVVKICSESNS